MARVAAVGSLVVAAVVEAIDASSVTVVSNACEEGSREVGVDVGSANVGTRVGRGVRGLVAGALAGAERVVSREGCDDTDIGSSRVGSRVAWACSTRCSSPDFAAAVVPNAATGAALGVVTVAPSSALVAIVPAGGWVAHGE